ncbi:MAG: hypothetical protein WCS90_01410 [Bacilli bacterium]
MGCPSFLIEMIACAPSGGDRETGFFVFLRKTNWQGIYRKKQEKRSSFLKKGRKAADGVWGISFHGAIGYALFQSTFFSFSRADLFSPRFTAMLNISFLHPL